MILQTQPTRWACLPTACAMVMGIPVDKIIKIIGHDGSEKIFNLPEPQCRRGFSLTDIALKLYLFGYSTTILARVENLTSNGTDIYTIKHDLKYIINNNDCVINYIQTLGKGHSVAYCHKTQNLYDPAGKIYNDWEIQIDSVILINKIRFS